MRMEWGEEHCREKRLKMNSEKDDLMLLRCSLKPKALPMCPLDLASPVVSIHSTRAYGSRGGSKVNAMKKKNVYWERKLGDAYLP